MSANEFSEIYIPPASRARRQRWLGLVLMALLSAFIACAIVWSFGELRYRSCLSQRDRAYIAAGGLDRITWRTTKTAAATQCSETNPLPSKYLA